MIKKLTIIILLTLISLYCFSQQKQFTIYAKNPDVYVSNGNGGYDYKSKYYMDINLYLDFENSLFSLLFESNNENLYYNKNLFSLFNIVIGEIIATELYDLKHKLIPPDKIKKMIKKDKVFRYIVYTENVSNDYDYMFMINYNLDKMQILETYDNVTYLFFLSINEISK